MQMTAVKSKRITHCDVNCKTVRNNKPTLNRYVNLQVAIGVGNCNSIKVLSFSSDFMTFIILSLHRSLSLSIIADNEASNFVASQVQ